MSGPRCLYTGSQDENARTKVFADDDAVNEALENGWRLHRVESAPVQQMAPVADVTAPNPEVIPAFDPQAENTATVKDRIALVTDPLDLDAIEAAERAHPTFEGGRAGVLKAITERRAELNG